MRRYMISNSVDSAVMTVYPNCRATFEDTVRAYAKEYLSECKKVLVTPLDTHGNRVKVAERWVSIDF